MEARSDIPTVLYGHSLGALIALSYALSDRPQPAMSVLSAPGLDADIPGYKKVMARVLGRLLPRVQIPNGIRGEQLSHDPTVGERYFADPLVHTKTTLRLGRFALLAGDEVRARMRELSTPTLVVHGEKDTLIPPAITEPCELADAVERRILPGLRHEVHNEGSEAVDLIADWIESRL